MSRFFVHLGLVALLSIGALGCSSENATVTTLENDGAVDWDAHFHGGPTLLPLIGECPIGPSSNLPSDSPRILVIGPSTITTSFFQAGDNGPAAIAQHLERLFVGDPTFQAPEVTVQLTDTPYSYSLMSFWYSPDGRAARITSLAGPFTWVVLLEHPTISFHYPELYFEGVRVVACAARAAGAKPVLLQPWDHNPAATPSQNRTHNTGLGEVAYRVGNGTGVPVVPFGYAAEDALSSAQIDAGAVSLTDIAFVAAASIYSAITGRSAATTTYRVADINAADQASFAGAAKNAVDTQAQVTHYTTPFPSVVERRTIAAQPELWFMSSGTSSEAIWFDRINEIVPKLGMNPKGTAIGACNDTKTFDAVCLDKANASFATAQYEILFARDYSVTAAAASAMQDGLQVQVWDRQFDMDPPDGVAAVGWLDDRSLAVAYQARTLGLAWIPFHLMFAKLKTARPWIQLTSDGTHVTYPVGYGLAAMSIESRTSWMAPTRDLDADTAAAVEFADETIRQLSSLSQWGTYVPDDPMTRPKVH